MSAQSSLCRSMARSSASSEVSIPKRSLIGLSTCAPQLLLIVLYAVRRFLDGTSVNSQKKPGFFMSSSSANAPGSGRSRCRSRWPSARPGSCSRPRAPAPGGSARSGRYGRTYNTSQCPARCSAAREASRRSSPQVQQHLRDEVAGVAQSLLPGRLGLLDQRVVRPPAGGPQRKSGALQSLKFNPPYRCFALTRSAAGTILLSEYQINS